MCMPNMALIRQTLIPPCTANTAQEPASRAGAPSRRLLRLQAPLALLVLPQCPLVEVDWFFWTGPIVNV
jgi:hypothetical protein